MAFLLAALAAFTNAITSVLQRIGVESAPESSTLRPSLMAHALKQGIWLVGFALMLVQFGLQATALKFGQLSTVQPVLTTELLFVLGIVIVTHHERPGVKEWLGAVGVVVGLVAFLVAARPSGDQTTISQRSAVIMSLAALVRKEDAVAKA